MRRWLIIPVAIVVVAVAPTAVMMLRAGSKRARLLRLMRTV